MNIHIKAPEYNRALGYNKVFLAGSIEQNTADKWQERFVKSVGSYVQHCRNALSNNIKPVAFLNPRRDDWDSSWTEDNPEFEKQVTWELEQLDRADIIAMYFDPNTKSPISLLELGLYAKSKKIIVCCPQGFWRRGNVEIVCAKYNIPFYSSVHAWETAIKVELTK